MLTLRTTKGSELTWIELDQNFTFLEGLINDAQNTINNIVTINTIQTITGQKDFSQLIKTDGIISRTSTNGGSYVDVNDGQISIGTGLNAADGTPEISIENTGYGMGIIFNPSDGSTFQTRVTFNESVSCDNNISVSGIGEFGDITCTTLYSSGPITSNFFFGSDTTDDHLIFHQQGIVLGDHFGNQFSTGSFGIHLGDHFGNQFSTGSSGIMLATGNAQLNISPTGGELSWTSGRFKTNANGFSIMDSIHNGYITSDSTGMRLKYGTDPFIDINNSKIELNTNSRINLIATTGGINVTGPLVVSGNPASVKINNNQIATVDMFKTVNGVSLLGSGDITIAAGGTGTVVYDTYSTVGRIASYTSLPTGYLLCNGQAVSRTTYSTLFAAIGTTYGAGDGSTTFNLPNLTEPTGVVVNTSADLPTDLTDYKTTLSMARSGTILVILATGVSLAHKITGLTLTPTTDYVSSRLPDSINFETCQGGGTILYIGNSFMPYRANVMMYNDDGSQLGGTTDNYIASCSKFKVCYLPNYSNYFVCGGYNGAPSNKTKSITSSLGVTFGEDLPVGLYNHTVTTLADGRVLITGGISSTGSSNGTYILTFTSATVFTVIVSNILPIDLFSHTATLLPDGKVLIIGGSSINDLTGYNDNAYILTITGDTISYSDPIMMPFAVMGHSAILTEFGRVIVAGGMVAGGTINQNYMMLSVTNTNKYIKY